MLLFINEDKDFGDRYFVLGRLIKDAELKNVGSKGTPLLTLKVSPGRDEDIVTVKLWSADALAYDGLKKGATIMADCRENAREYNGKLYKDYTANLIMCADEVYAPTKKRAGSKGKTVDPEPYDGGFTDFDQGDLPFDIG